MLDFFGGTEGPHYDRYNLVVNCGSQQEGNAAVAGANNAGKVYLYNNASSVCATRPAMAAARQQIWRCQP